MIDDNDNMKIMHKRKMLYSTFDFRRIIYLFFLDMLVRYIYHCLNLIAETLFTWAYKGCKELVILEILEIFLLNLSQISEILPSLAGPANY